MNLQYINETSEDFTPEQITEIDKTHSIIFSIPTQYPNLMGNDDDFIYFTNVYSFQPHSLKMINDSEVAYEYKPQMKICYPKGIIFNFYEKPSEKSVISNIFTNFDRVKTYGDNRLINSISFSIYFDRTRLKKYEISLIDISQMKIVTDFKYSVFAEQEVENIYIINNTFVYSDFEKHFCV